MPKRFIHCAHKDRSNKSGPAFPDEPTESEYAIQSMVELEEKRLGRHLNPRETDDLVRRFFNPRNTGEYPPINSQGGDFKAREQKDS